jgi:hypothetical protein
MKKHVSVRCGGEQEDGQCARRQHTLRHGLLLACMALAFSFGDPPPGKAVNGEPVGAEGLFRSGAVCPTDFAISCDDRPQSKIASCHMRGAKGDEGLAVNACIDGRVTVGLAKSEFLEKQVAIDNTDFGMFVCGKEFDNILGKLVDFCVVCDTLAGTATVGASKCVKITNNQQTSEEGVCGAYNITNGTTAACAAQTQSLRQAFTSPNVGFTIGFNASDAGQPDAKDLVLCGQRSWQCIDNRSEPLAIEAEQVQRQQAHELINTGCCIKLASGANYCSTKITTCR